MKKLTGRLTKSPYMTDEQKIDIAWSEMELAIKKRDLKRIFNLAYWIKAILKSYYPNGKLPKTIEF